MIGSPEPGLRSITAVERGCDPSLIDRVPRSLALHDQHAANGGLMDWIRRRLFFRSSGERAAPRSWRTLVAGLVSWCLVAAVAGVVGNYAFQLVDEAGRTTDGDRTPSSELPSAREGPARLSVTYGSVNDPSAVFPDGMPSLPPPGGYDETLKWISSNGGVLANSTVANLSIKAPQASEAPVYVKDVRVRLVKCEEALSGVYMPGLGAGDLFDRVLDYQLDDIRNGPARRLFSFTNNKAWRFPLWVDNTESEVIAIIVGTWAGYYEFAIDVDYTYLGRSYTESVATSDAGDVLKITGKSRGGDVLYVPPWDKSNYTVMPFGEYTLAPDYITSPETYEWVPGRAWVSEMPEPPSITRC